MIWLTDNFYIPIISVPLLVGFLKFRTNSKSFIAAITIAIVSTSISGYIVGDLATISLMCGMIGSAIGLFGMHYWQVHQGTLNVNTQSAKFTNKNTEIYSKIDQEEKIIQIASQLRKQSFIQGVEEGHMRAAKKSFITGL